MSIVWSVKMEKSCLWNGGGASESNWWKQKAIKMEKNMRMDRTELIETKGDVGASACFSTCSLVLKWSLISLSQSPHVAITHNQYYLSKIKSREENRCLSHFVPSLKY